MKVLLIMTFSILLAQAGFAQQEVPNQTTDSSRVAVESNAMLRHKNRRVQNGSRSRPNENISTPVYRARPVFDPSNPNPQKLQRDTISPFMRARVGAKEKEE